MVLDIGKCPNQKMKVKGHVLKFGHFLRSEIIFEISFLIKSYINTGYKNNQSPSVSNKTILKNYFPLYFNILRNRLLGFVLFMVECYFYLFFYFFLYFCIQLANRAMGTEREKPRQQGSFAIRKFLSNPEIFCVIQLKNNIIFVYN